MKDIRTETTINASAKKVWEVLTDFSKYPQWNGFIDEIHGELAVGEELEIKIKPKGAEKEFVFKPKIEYIEANRELRLKTKVLFSSVFSGEYVILIEPIGFSEVRFIQGAVFKGIFLSFLWEIVSKAASVLFEAMNQALKAEAERV